VTVEVGDERGGSAGSIPDPSGVTTSPSTVTVLADYRAGRNAVTANIYVPLWIPALAFIVLCFTPDIFRILKDLIARVADERSVTGFSSGW